MANLFTKLRDYITGDTYDEDEEYDDYDEEYDDEDYDEPVRNYKSSYSASSNIRPVRRSHGGYDKIVSINTNINMQVVISSPKSLEAASDICMNLKEKKTVIVNLEDADGETAQRISDFLCGACYALDGSIQLISNDILIVGPVNVNITGQFKEDLKANGIKLPYTRNR